MVFLQILNVVFATVVAIVISKRSKRLTFEKIFDMPCNSVCPPLFLMKLLLNTLNSINWQSFKVADLLNKDWHSKNLVSKTSLIFFQEKFNERNKEEKNFKVKWKCR